jgi:hypothetical protein
MGGQQRLQERPLEPAPTTEELVPSMVASIDNDRGMREPMDSRSE